METAGRPFRSEGSLLEARGLGRRSRSTSEWLFREIDLDICSGDRLALVGPTGSGKSLILRAMAVLDPVDEGEVLWAGQPIADAAVPEFRCRVMYLQQRSPVIEGTVEDNLRIPFSLHLRQDTPFPEVEVEELLKTLGKESRFLASQTANLSGGERQMVALLRALLVAPTILLLDEPSAALDSHATTAIESLVDAWHAHAPTERAYLWVSHDSAQAQRVGRKIIRLSSGRTEAT